MRKVLLRGWKRRCPRCGIGPLFERGLKFNARCSNCDLVFQRNYGDTWIWMVITDRIPIFFGIVALYFGMVSISWTGTVLLFFAIATPMIATIRQRLGLALALDYLSRLYFRDPSDPIHAAR
ncbi:MAG TPA: hypothetical protein VJ853_05125 [Thermoanaerobaculia bacterium]|nr:hypothetical protein [Thermoanaerobaculia bacterium]